MYPFPQDIKYRAQGLREGRFSPQRAKGLLVYRMDNSWPQAACPSCLCRDPSPSWFLEMRCPLTFEQHVQLCFGLASEHSRPPRQLWVMVHITLFGNITIWWISLYLLSKTRLCFANWGHPGHAGYSSCTLALRLVFEEARIEGQVRKTVLCFMLLSWNLGAQSALSLQLDWFFTAAQWAPHGPALKEFHRGSLNLDRLCRDHRKFPRSGKDLINGCSFLHSWLKFNPWNLTGGKTAFLQMQACPGMVKPKDLGSDDTLASSA